MIAKVSRAKLRYCTKANKAFKSDSQRLAVSLRSSIAQRRSHLNAALVCKRKNVAISQDLAVKVQS
ncbi:hypothetical protein CGJ87_24230 [Vibrio parahaemolyticus]|nr:hypothetical protein [Vibrio parahaemolyticus]EGQ9921576.1 hypothetical protein [Vibrio parahaemolyticus]EGR1504683.1 hypothetical protein [Vibrio parahaemolyticus]EGV2732296.1 hypothetical protein [Vibrio parahaemolyticus]TOC26280.1 hypothetical protein CGJ87_24230 [Vibrio parahaemolyticus]